MVGVTVFNAGEPPKGADVSNTGQYPAPEQVIVHLSDTHFVADGSLLMGEVDSDGHLAGALRRLADSGLQPAAIVVTGDIADTGAASAYARVRAQLEPVAAELGARLVWVMGNHDRRPEFRAGLLDEAPTDAPVDEVVDLDGLRLVVLDTSVPGYHHGELTQAQLGWLRGVLETPAPRGTVLALHHPPIPLPIPITQLIELRDQAGLADVLAGSDVRAIIGGHLHYSTWSLFAGIPVSVAAASCYTTDLVNPGPGVRGVDGGQSFNLIHVYPDQIVHSIVPIGDYRTVYQVEVTAEELAQFATLSPEEQRDVMLARDPSA